MCAVEGGVFRRVLCGGTRHPLVCIVTRQVERSTFVLWLQATTCEDPEWLAVGRTLPLCAGEERMAALWLSWPGHERHALRCME